MRKATFDFHPQFLHRTYQADFGYAYVWEPAVTAQVNYQVALGLYRDFGHAYPSLFPPPLSPEKQTSFAFSMQPLDFLNGARGAEMGYTPDEHICSVSRSLARLQDLSAIADEEDIDWERNPWWQQVLRYLEKAARLYPSNSRIAGTPCAALLDPTCNDALLVTHTAYTTAFRLLGEDIFVMMLTDPEAAWALFRYILRQYHQLFALSARTFNWQETRYHFGDCAATMLSPDLFRQFNRPIMDEIAQTGVELTWHTCGPSTHLLEVAAGIPNLTHLQLGDGTDLARARQLFPDAEILAYYGAAALLRENPETITRRFDRFCRDLQDNFLIMFSSVDPRTPKDNIITAMQLAESFNQSQL